MYSDQHLESIFSYEEKKFWILFDMEKYLKNYLNLG